VQAIPLFSRPQQIAVTAITVMISQLVVIFIGLELHELTLVVSGVGCRISGSLRMA